MGWKTGLGLLAHAVIAAASVTAKDAARYIKISST